MKTSRSLGPDKKAYLAICLFFANVALAEELSWNELLARAEQQYAGKNFAAAEEDFALAEKAAGSDDVAVATVLNVGANAACGRSEYSKAIALYVRAADIWTKKLRRKETPYAVLLNNFGFCLMRSNDLPRARGMLDAARQTLVAEKAPDAVLLSMITNNLGEVAYQQAQYAEAEKFFLEALELRRANLDQNDPLLGVSYNNLGYVASALGKYDEAIPLYESSLAIIEKRFGESPQTAHAAHNLGEACREFGDEERAETLLKRAVAIREKFLQSELAVSLNSLAELYVESERPKEAIPLLKRAIEITEKDFGKSSPVLVPMLETLATAQVAAEQYLQAEESYRRLIPLTSPPPLANLAFVLSKQGMNEEAERIYRRVLEESEKSNGEKSIALVRPLRDLARVLVLENKPEESLPLLLRAKEILGSSGSENSADLAAVLGEISENQQTLGACVDAAQALNEAETVASKAFGADSAEVREYRDRRGKLVAGGCRQS